VTQQPVLDVLRLQGIAQQRVRAKIDHTHRQVIASPPIGIGLPQLFARKGHHNLSWANHENILRNALTHYCVEPHHLTYRLNISDAEGNAGTQVA
jgi:hypothetical protein